MVHTVILFLFSLLTLPTSAAYLPFKIGNGTQAVTDAKYLLINGSKLTDSGSGTVRATVKHSGLLGLTADDHTQYHNDSRALTWLGTKSTTDLSEGTNKYYTGARVNGDILDYSTSAGWSAEDNGGTMRSLQLSGDNGASFNVTSISGNGGALRVTLDSSLLSGGNGGTLGSINNGDIYTTISNGTGYYTTLRINNSAIYNGSIFNTAFATKSTTNLSEGTNLYYTAIRANGDALQVGTEQGWSAEDNGGTMRSIQPSGDNGFSFSVSSISGNGGALRGTFDSSLYQPSNGNLTTWAGKSVPSGVVVGTTDTQTLSNKTFSPYYDMATTTVPATPSSNTNRFYSKATNGIENPYFIGSDGLEIRLGRDLVSTVRNTSGVTISAGEMVYVTGATGTALNIAKARADSPSTMVTVGMAMQTINNNNYGRIQRFGRNEFRFDTSAYSVGDLLYVSSTTNGGLTNVKPPHPNLNQPIGVVAVSGVGTGSVFIDIGDAGGDDLGTRENLFAIGDRLAGTKILTFKNVYNGNLQWTPTATRTITIPDVTGTLVTGGGTASGINTGDQTITLTGDVTGSGTGSFTTTVASQTSANWATKISDEVGTGRLVFNGSTTLSTPTLNKAITINGSTLSIPAVTQGDILFAKTTSTIKPLAKGTNHYALKVNGNTLAWESIAAGGSSEWTDNGSNLYPNELGDSISIGKDFNNGKLNLNGDIAFQTMASPTLGMSDYARLYVKSSTNNLTFMKYDGMSGTEISLIPSGTTITSGGSSTDNHVPVWVGTGGNSLEDSPVVIDPTMGDMTGVGSLAISGGMGTPLAVSTNALLVDSGGNVGISTTSPDHRLDVTGTSEFSDQLDIANNKYISWSDGMSYTNILGLNSSNDLILQGSDGMMSGGNILIKPAQVEAMRLDKNGNIGIFDKSPDYLLDVNGSAFAKSFTLNGTAASLPSLTQGDILFSKVSANLNRLAKGTNHYALRVNGNTLAYESVPSTGNNLSYFAATTSAQLAGVISDEVGTGRLVFNGSTTLASPTLITPAIGVATGTSLVTTGKIVAGTNLNGSNLAVKNGGYFIAGINFGNGGTTESIDFSKNNNFAISLNAATLAISAGTDPTGDTRFSIAINQRTGSQAVTWTACASASGFCFPGGTVPTITAAANSIDIISCWYRIVKDRYYCVQSADFR